MTGERDLSASLEADSLGSLLGATSYNSANPRIDNKWDNLCRRHWRPNSTRSMNDWSPHGVITDGSNADVRAPTLPRLPTECHK
jgi:hypothetical protein